MGWDRLGWGGMGTGRDVARWTRSLSLVLELIPRAVMAQVQGRQGAGRTLGGGQRGRLADRVVGTVAGRA